VRERLLDDLITTCEDALERPVRRAGDALPAWSSLRAMGVA